MTRYVAAMICLCLAACGALYLSHESGTELEQHAHDVPTDDQLRQAVSVFADEATKAGYVFSAQETLTIEWHAPGEVFYIIAGADAPYVENETIDGYRVRVTSFSGLAHELAHVMFFRNTGDGDSNHEQPPGPWTEDTNALVRRVSDRYASELRE